jgi:hypothetical protein
VITDSKTRATPKRMSENTWLNACKLNNPAEILTDKNMADEPASIRMVPIVEHESKFNVNYK